MRILLLLATAAVVLASCGPAEPVHDKTYWRAHDDERATKLAACRNDPGKLAASPNCVNAQAADADAHADKFYEVEKPASRVQSPGSL